MNSRRLLMLASYLTKVPRKRFRMGCWADGKFCKKPNETKHACNTAGCAVGWGTTIPSFAKAGLKLKIDPDCGEGLVPHYRGRTQFDAAASFFDISLDDSEYLFAPWKYWPITRENNITPSVVAKRIRKFVTDKIRSC